METGLQRESRPFTKNLVRWLSAALPISHIISISLIFRSLDMSRSRTMFFGALSGAIITSTACAESVTVIGEPSKSSLQTIGKEALPEETTPELSLGNLRVGEATLPPKEQTLEERMALRNQRALERQKEIDEARRTVKSSN